MATDTILTMLGKPDKTGHPVDFALDNMRDSGQTEMYEGFLTALASPQQFTAGYIARIFCEAGFEIKGPQVSGWRRREGYVNGGRK